MEGEKIMARFYGDLQGNRGEATRQGTTASGIEGHIRGWHIGFKVVCHARDIDDHEIDECIVYQTGGSNGYGSYKEVARARHPPIMSEKWKWEKK